ncbi:MAG: hypothetical protein ACI4TF_07185, partial [Oliverpabstia sp.]
RPPGPKPGALAKLSHTPDFLALSFSRSTQDILYYSTNQKSTLFFIFFIFFVKHPDTLLETIL